MSVEDTPGDEEHRRQSEGSKKNSYPPGPGPITEAELKALLDAPPGQSISDIIAELERELEQGCTGR